MRRPRALTIFTVPKAFSPPIEALQRNAIESWRRLQPRVDILILGDEEGSGAFARDLGAGHVAEVERDRHGTPLLASVLDLADRHARTPYVAFVNADILLTDDFLGALEAIPWPEFLMVGSRVDVEISGPWNFERTDGVDALRRHAAARGRAHPPTGSDYFVYPRGFWRDVPPFVIGRPYFDNWLMYEAVRRGVPLVDASPAFLCIHQRHDYGHIAGGLDGYWKGEQTTLHRRLLGGLENLYTLEDATHRLTPQGIVRNPGRGAREAERMAEAARHPGWVPEADPRLFVGFTNNALKLPVRTVDLLGGRA